MAGIIDRDSTSSPGSPMAGGTGDSSSLTPASPLPPAGQGWLLQEPSQRRVLRFVWSRWEQWKDEESRWHANWKANRWRRAGLTGVVVQRPDGDRSEWRTYAPPGSARVAPAFNMAARLCRQLKANVWADPPAPEAVPAQAGNDDAINAAEFAGRFLRTLDAAPVDLAARQRETFDLASTYDSGFTIFDVNPHGAGLKLREIEASRLATTVAEATHRYVPGPDGVLVPEALPDITLRYVAKDGVTITDDPDAAAIDWLPGIRPLPLTPYQVRPTTKDAIDVESAEGLLVARYQTLGAVRAKYPAVRELSFAELRKLVDFEPDEPLRYLPQGVKTLRKLTADDLRNRYGRFVAEDEEAEGEGLAGAEDPVSEAGQLRALAAEGAVAGVGDDDDAAGDPSDEARDPNDIPDDIHIFTLEQFQAGRSPGYPWGAHVCVAGGADLHGRVLYRAELAGQQVVEGRMRKEALPIPVAQAKQFGEGLLDFYGVGAMTILGPGNEARASLVGSLVEHLDRFNRRKVFYNPSSLFQPKAAHGSMGTYIPVAPGDAPVTEQVPDFPRAGSEMFALSTEELKGDIGLSDVSQGKTDPSVKSALHAATLIEQVVVNLSDVKQNAERYILRCWRICLALAWAHYDRQQTLASLGEDQAYKAEDWMGADLGATRDVRIMRGSFSMLAPSAKLQVAEYGLGIGLIDLYEMKRLFAGNYGADLGVQDDPALMRVRRQLTAFWQGPPPDWTPPVPPQPMVDPMTGAPMLDPATGQPMMTPAEPPSFTPFNRVPSDLEPAPMTPVTMASEGQGMAGKQAGVPPAPVGGTAMLRARELGRALNGARFERLLEQHPAWAQLLVDEYGQMCQAAGILFMDQMQEQMQAQAQQEQAALAAQQEAEAARTTEEAKRADVAGAAEAQSAELDLGKQQADLALDAERKRSELEFQKEKQKIALQAQREKARASRSQTRSTTRRN